MGRPPGNEEVQRALTSLKNEKSPGRSHIWPEMMKVGRHNVDFIEMVLDVLSSKSGLTLSQCPFLRRENVKSCDNWQGIALLEVVG